MRRLCIFVGQTLVYILDKNNFSVWMLDGKQAFYDNQQIASVHINL